MIENDKNAELILLTLQTGSSKSSVPQIASDATSGTIIIIECTQYLGLDEASKIK